MGARYGKGLLRAVAKHRECDRCSLLAAHTRKNGILAYLCGVVVSYLIDKIARLHADRGCGRIREYIHHLEQTAVTVLYDRDTDTNKVALEPRFKLCKLIRRQILSVAVAGSEYEILHAQLVELLLVDIAVVQRQKIVVQRVHLAAERALVFCFQRIKLRLVLSAIGRARYLKGNYRGQQYRYGSHRRAGSFFHIHLNIS